jgi:hypothetical protein
MRRTLALLALASLFVAGCVEMGPYESTGGGGGAIAFPAPPEPAVAAAPAGDTGRLQLQWPASVSPRYQGYYDAMRGGEFEQWIERLDGHLVLPEDLTILHTECGIENAYYSPDEKRITMCWELLDRISYVMQDPQLTAEESAMGVGSVWLFVVLHEMGHGLIDVLDIPVTGREEDAVDDLASILLIDSGATDAALNAAVFWILTDDGSISDAKFADEHSLNAQRFYTILCTVYGSAPSEYADVVELGYLPYERAQRCPREYQQKDASWEKLLGPHMVSA